MFRKQIVFCALLIISECSGLISHLNRTRVRVKEIATDLCGPINEINLPGTGNAASQLVVLSASDKRICKLRVTAPKNFLVKLHFPKYFSLFNDYYPPCKMRIFLGNSSSVESIGVVVDPCSDMIFQDHLFPSDFTIAWEPLRSHYFFNKNILLSTLGAGEVCKEDTFFICEWLTPAFEEVCVDSSLVCDGTINCPFTSPAFTNHDEAFCESLSYENSQEKVHIPEYKYKVTTSVTSYRKELGWGGSLVVAIMLCVRLCVYCARLQKVPKSGPEAHPIQTTETECEADTVARNQAIGPTVVLIVHEPDEELTLKEERDVEETNTNPPKYEDLEQPPPYSSLL